MDTPKAELAAMLAELEDLLRDHWADGRLDRLCGGCARATEIVHALKRPAPDLHGIGCPARYSLGDCDELDAIRLQLSPETDTEKRAAWGDR